MTIAEAAQRLRLPLISKDGEIHEDEIEKCGMMSRSSLDSTCTSFTVSSSSNSTNCTTANSNSAANNNMSLSAADVVEPAIGGVPNCFLGITPGYLWQTQLQQTPFSMVQCSFGSGIQTVVLFFYIFIYNLRFFFLL